LNRKDEKCKNCKHNEHNPLICLPMIFFLKCQYKRKNKKKNTN